MAVACGDGNETAARVAHAPSEVAATDGPGVFQRADHLAAIRSWTAPHAVTPSSPSA